MEEAVRAFTYGSAYAEFQENQKGSIAAGKLADLIVLSEDVFTMNANDLRRAKVLTTIVDGRVIYETTGK